MGARLASASFVDRTFKDGRLRAVEALEYINATTVRELLQVLCNGTTEARLTQDAKASLEPLNRRHPEK